MSRGSLARGVNKNKIVPIDDIISERIEVSPQRFIRVLRYSPTVEPSAIVRGSKTSTSSIENRDSDNVIVIFFIHGVGGCAELWNGQLRHFCKAGYAVVALDLLGHGASSCPRDQKQYEFSELSKDVVTIFDRFSRRRNILVGHSYGASFCCLIASIRLRRVSKIVLISGGAPIPLMPESWSVFCLPIPLLTLIKPFLLWSFERRAFYNKYRSTNNKVRAFSAPLYVIKAILQGQKWEAGGETFHNELMVPALLIHGAQDKFVCLQDEQWMQEAIYSSSLEVIPDSGHMVMLESPEKVNWFIHNFLQRDPTTRSKIISTSREVSKDSIHVRSKVTSTAKRLSLAVESPAEFLVDSIRERSQSVSHIRSSSSVSLKVPKASGVRSNSLPGSTADIVMHSKKDQKSTFKVVEIHVTNENTVATEGSNSRAQGCNSEHDFKTAAIACNDSLAKSHSGSDASSLSSPKERKRGAFGMPKGSLPSVQT